MFFVTTSKYLGRRRGNKKYARPHTRVLPRYVFLRDGRAFAGCHSSVQGLGTFTTLSRLTQRHLLGGSLRCALPSDSTELYRREVARGNIQVVGSQLVLREKCRFRKKKVTVQSGCLLLTSLFSVSHAAAPLETTVRGDSPSVHLCLYPRS